jgi:hypothetical protein
MGFTCKSGKGYKKSSDKQEQRQEALLGLQTQKNKTSRGCCGVIFFQGGAAKGLLLAARAFARAV